MSNEENCYLNYLFIGFLVPRFIPAVISPSGNIRYVASGFLNKYQAYSKDSGLDDINSGDATENRITTVDNLRLIVTIYSFSSSLIWKIHN